MTLLQALIPLTVLPLIAWVYKRDADKAGRTVDRLKTVADVEEELFGFVRPLTYTTLRKARTHETVSVCLYHIFFGLAVLIAIARVAIYFRA